METDLHLTDTQYLLCLTLFFISYALFEVSDGFGVRCSLECAWSA